MNNNSSPYNDNNKNAAADGEDQSDALSSFATAAVVSLTREFGASIDNGIEAAKAPAIDGARVVFARNGRGRRPSSIL